MSGPKVVRIVTREEVQAICRQHLRAFDAAVAQLRESATKHGMWNEALAAGLTARVQELSDLFEKDRFLDIQKGVPAQIEFLKTEVTRIETVAIERAANERQKARRLSDAARSLATALDGIEISADLSAALTRAKNTTLSIMAATEATLNQAFAVLCDASSKATSAEQSELAKRLGAGEKAKTFAEWAASQPPGPKDGNERVDRLMAEIEVLGDASAAQSFLAKAAKVLDERVPDRRRLLTDSLTLELSDHVKAQRAAAAVLARLKTTVADLSAFEGGEPDALRAEARRVADRKDAQSAKDLVMRIEALIAERMAHAAALARRKAILGGLAALGYEVREGMATAWAQSGRLVVKKPGAADYGVELGAAAAAEQVQVRLVGAANPSEARTATRDRDAEAIWCSEFDRLRTSLVAQGGDIKIERALPVGAQPVKTLVFEDAGGADVAAITRPQKTLQKRLD